jgi:hypothetical protein
VSDATTFTLRLAQPLGLLFLVAVPVILWLHRRRRRPARAMVPSLVPWAALGVDAPRPRRQVPPTVLLLLHLATAALLALALADPRLPGASHPSGDQVVILDTTTSMGAGTRWEAARERVRALARATTGEFSLVTLGPRPRVLVARATDPRATDVVLAGLVPGGTGDRVDEALALAAAVAGARATRDVVTDGGGAIPSDGALDARWNLVGTPVANRAVTHAAARRAGADTRLFARLANFADAPDDVVLSLRLDDQPYDTRRVTLAANATFDTVWSVPAEAIVAEVRIDGGDALPADDTVVVPLTEVPTTVQLIGQSRALTRALAAIPDVAVETAGWGDFRADGTVDVSVFVGGVPPALPPGGVIVFDPAPGELARPRRAAAAATVDGVADHPAVRGLALSGTRLEGVTDPEVPVWAEPLLVADGLVAAFGGTVGASRTIVFAFDPDGGDLPERLAFPLLVARAVAWACSRPTGGVVQAGASVALPSAPSRVQMPDGRTLAAWGGFDRTGLAGLYRVTVGAGDTLPTLSFAVEAGDVRESDLRRRLQPPAPLRAAPTRADGGGGRPVWGWLAAAALGIVLVEGACRRRGDAPSARGGGRV